METTLLNPFSIRLKKPPFMEMRTEPTFENGDFKIYRYCDQYFVHTFKNIVIAERCKANPAIFTNIKGETEPTGEADIYHQLERPRQAMTEGIQEAKKLKFVVR